MKQLNEHDCALLFPPNVGLYWQSQLRLTRFLRHNRGLALGLETHAIRAVIREWCLLAAEHFPTLATAGGIDADDTFCVVSDHWTDAHWPLGVSPVAKAAEMSKDVEALPPTPEGYGPAHSAVWRLAWCVNLLCLKHGESSFWLSSRDVSARLGITQPVAFHALRRLEKDGHLLVEKRGFPGMHKGRATVYKTR